MNQEALKLSIETGEMHYYSRSRQKIWLKGETSGFKQTIKELLIDDDQDALWMSVDIGTGGSCHVGYRSCFYRSVPIKKISDEKKIKLEFKEKNKIFDPKKVYKNESNPTKL